MDRYMITLAIGFGGFLVFAGWCVWSVLWAAHKEDPGCLNLLKHK